jgi:alpha-2-macroglobulin
MNKLNDAVLRLARALWKGARFLLLPLGRLLGAIFGRWQPPSWTAPAGRVASAHPAWVLLAVVLAVGAVAAPKLMKVDWAGKFAALRSVQPDRAAALAAAITVTSPERTEIERDGAKPNPAVLTFAVSAAPLARVGKEAQDVSM